MNQGRRAMAEFRSILPPDNTMRAPLLAVMAIMTYLAALSLAGAVILHRATAAWTSDLAGAVTVQIKPSPTVTPEVQRTDAVKVLSAAPGIAEARPLNDDDVKKLIEPWLGQSAELRDLPVPQLIDVRLVPHATVDLAALGARLAEKVPGATLDDHRGWNDRLLRLSHQVSGLGIAVLMLITMATVGIVIFATRAGLRANHETVEVLHLVGARDGFIAQAFERHFLWVGLRAGALGVGLAVLTMLAIAISLPRGDFFLPDLTLAWTDPVALLLVPMIAALVAMLTARLTVLNVLRALP